MIFPSIPSSRRRLHFLLLVELLISLLSMYPAQSQRGWMDQGPEQGLPLDAYPW